MEARDLSATTVKKHQHSSSSNMGKLETPFFYTLIFLASLISAHAAARCVGAVPSSFDSVYAFGDSLTDTGNLLLYQLNISGYHSSEGRLPYGETFFHKPTGRCSDGRLVVDFLANRVRAPHFLLPYLGLDDSGQINGNGSSLVNFAVAGATAQNVDYLNATFNISVDVPYSTDKQLQWFSTLPISKDKDAFSKALVYFGEIGTNDYYYALKNGFSIDNIIIKLVPNVIKIIKKALEFLIHSGAKYLVVQGVYPIGCTPSNTRLLFVNATTNKHGCVEKLYKLGEVHDKLLKQLVQDLATKYNQDVHIIFFNQLKAYVEIVRRASHYGFTNTIDPCFDIFNLINFTNVEACPDPSTYVSWDGSHFTEATHSVLVNLFYTKGFVTPYPNFLTSF